MAKIKEINKSILAVIQTGGKQYLVKEGDSLRVEKIKNIGKDGSITFDKVLFLADDKSAEGGVKIGAPYIEGAKVLAKSEGEMRGKKITVLRYKSKTRYRKKKGHRQTYTKIKIIEIK
jgi:large subunit ribosomal protein L21